MDKQQFKKAYRNFRREQYAHPTKKKLKQEKKVARKGITSKDSRKAHIVEALKELSCGSKVTMVQEDETHYYGNCMVSAPHPEGYARTYFKELGEFKISKKELKL